MDPFELHILGCGSAKPNTRHFSACQVLSYRQKLFMIDCGEAAQIQMCHQKLSFARLGAIFISHLHGDHCLGLLGLVSTMNLLGRTAQLHVYAPRGAKELFSAQIAFFNPQMSYEVIFHEFSSRAQEVIYEDRSITVTTIPLSHRIECCGFLFREKDKPLHIRPGVVEAYEIPISQIGLVKAGRDFVQEDGTVIANERLTLPADPVRSYAYCSDTRYLKEMASMVRGVSLLYHEATFCQEDEARAHKTFHTTSREAATVARDAEAKRLVVGHYSSRYHDESQILLEAQEIFPDTVLAREGLTVPVGIQ